MQLLKSTCCLFFDDLDPFSDSILVGHESNQSRDGLRNSIHVFRVSIVVAPDLLADAQQVVVEELDEG